MIEIEDHGRVRRLRLNRPPVNAFDRALLESLDAAMRQAVADDKGAVVVCGQQGLFSAGLDIRALLPLPPAEMRSFWRLLIDVQATIAQLPIPVIAALTGHCAAGGTVLALCCDYRIMAAGDWKIGLNEVQVGLFPGRLIHRAFARLVGPHRAGEMLARGALIGPDTALTVGLVDEVRPMDEVVTRAHAYAEELLNLPPRAFMRTRAMARADLVALFDTVDEAMIDEVAEGWFSEETQSRLRALFVRKNG